jgi:hypothetical protein
MTVVAGIVIGLTVGWVLGMWTRKRSALWCPMDGAQLTCPRCATQAVHPLDSPANLARQPSTVEGGGAA